MSQSQPIKPITDYQVLDVIFMMYLMKLIIFDTWVDTIVEVNTTKVGYFEAISCNSQACINMHNLMNITIN